MVWVLYRPYEGLGPGCTALIIRCTLCKLVLRGGFRGTGHVLKDLGPHLVAGCSIVEPARGMGIGDVLREPPTLGDSNPGLPPPTPPPLSGETDNHIVFAMIRDIFEV